MERIVNKEEQKILGKDHEILINFCNNIGINTEKINGTKVLIGDKKDCLGGAGMVKENGDIVLAIKLEDFNNNLKRRWIFFHEIGHKILGLRNKSEEERNKLVEKFKEKYRLFSNLNNDLDISPITCIKGLNMIEEYIVEKFAQRIAYDSLGIKEPKKISNMQHELSGNYTYNTTFFGGYGIIEELLENLMKKIYNDTDDLLIDSNTEDFFSRFIDKFEEADIILILYLLGTIYKDMRLYAETKDASSSENIESILKYLKTFIENLNIKNKSKEKNK